MAGDTNCGYNKENFEILMNGKIKLRALTMLGHLRIRTINCLETTKILLD